MRVLFTALSLFAFCGLCRGDEFSKALQDVSVTIKAGDAEGSGTIFTRDVKNGKDDKGKDIIEHVNFVWTAGHVVAGLRDVREIIDSIGTPRKVSEFRDCAIVKEINKDGRRVGELKMDVKVIKYSDADNGEDLALLRVIESDFIKANADFRLGKDIPDVGTRLYHVGSLLGQMGANSMTEGIMSQIGRVYKGKVFDQTTVTAFPGSSGGGVFIKTDKGLPQYIGMVTLGSGETFNMIVGARRMCQFCKTNKIEWAMDAKAQVPTMDDLEKIPVEGVAKSALKDADKPATAPVPTPPQKPKTLEYRGTASTVNILPR